MHLAFFILLLLLLLLLFYFIFFNCFFFAVDDVIPLPVPCVAHFAISRNRDFRNLVFSIKKEVPKNEVGMARVVASNLVLPS